MVDSKRPQAAQQSEPAKPFRLQDNEDRYTPEEDLPEENKPEGDQERSTRQANELKELTDQHVKNTAAARAVAEELARRKNTSETELHLSNEVREAVMAEHQKFAKTARQLLDKHLAEAPKPPSPHAKEKEA